MEDRTPPPLVERPSAFGMLPKNRILLAAAGAGALVLAGGVGGVMGATLTRSQAVGSAAISLPGAAGGAPSSFADVAERVKPAVVSVHVREGGDLQASLPDGPLGEFFRRFGTPERQQPRESAGSGFFISEDGYIVTNNHVVQNGNQLSVTLDDGRTLDARLIGVDERTDLAVIKVEGGQFPYVRFAEHEPRIGDWVLAVGNPFGLGGTVTSGIVSARGRDIGAGPYDDFLQIDAPVNQGNSGGPAFNLAGEVVGVNTAIYSPSGGNVGIAFAISAATAQPIVDSLRRNGTVTRGYLGVAAQPLNDDIARSMGLRNTHGALVAEVTDNSPAARAGLQPGDIITKINDREINDARALARVVGSVEPGAETEITYVRDGRTRTARVALASLTNDQAQQSRQAASGKPGAGGSQTANETLGVATAPSSGGGVVVTGIDPNGPAAERGIEQGDIILEAGGRAIANPQDLASAVDGARRDGRGVLLLRVQSGQGAGYVAVPIGRG
ncbi:MAG: Do family serine endopeptidase [Caulobacterales bacterium]